MNEIKPKPCPFCGSSHVYSRPDGDSVMCRRIDNDGHTSIKCPNCGGQIDFHAGHIDNGHVFICEKGKPLSREVKYYCDNCDSVIIFIKKCEPDVTDHD